MHSKISKMLAILTATTILIVNYGSLSVYADNNFTSRFPGNKSNSASQGNYSTGNDGVTDENWVDHKDDDRHNLSSYKGFAAGTKGNASGPQAVELSDGSWYWYHQSSHGCTYGINADGTLNVGAARLSVKTEPLNANGCGLYSSSMVLSNLYGRPICIDEMITQMGAKLRGNVFDLTGVEYINTSGYSDTKFAEALAESWGVEVDAFLPYGPNDPKKDEYKARIDTCLDAGGMVVVRYGMPGRDTGNNGLDHRSTAGHFSTIRNKTSSGEYLMLDSCFKFCSDKDRYTTIADTPVDWDSLWEHSCMDGSGSYRSTYYMCISLKGGSRLNSSTGGNTGQVNSQTGNWNSECTWYGPGTAIANYTDKKDLGEGFYLYNGLPWIPDENTYTVDTDTALNDWFKYMESKNGSKLTYSDGSAASAKDIIANSNRLKETSDDDFQGSAKLWKTSDGGSYALVDGLKAVPICVPPIVVDTYFNTNFTNADSLSDVNWTNSDKAARSKYKFGKSKMAVALYDKSTREIWFMPVVNCNELDNTKPGGVATTASNSLISKLFGRATSSADYVSTVAEFCDLPNAVKTVIGSNGNYAVCGYVVWD